MDEKQKASLSDMEMENVSGGVGNAQVSLFLVRQSVKPQVERPGIEPDDDCSTEVTGYNQGGAMGRNNLK